MSESSINASSPKILVVGCTQGIGSHVLSKLSSIGPVRAMVRESSLSKLQNQYSPNTNVQIVIGDLLDHTSFPSLVEGIETVISCAAATGGKNASPHTIDYLGTKELMRCAYDAGARNFVLVTSVGVERPYYISSLFLNIFAGKFIHWKREAELSLHEIFKDRNYLIIRPGWLVDSKGNEKSVEVGQGDKYSVMRGIPREDVAECIVQWVSHPEYQQSCHNASIDLVSHKTQVAPTDWTLAFSNITPDQ
jgi:nucleoside-diphosphate-sugar epimerase